MIKHFFVALAFSLSLVLASFADSPLTLRSFGAAQESGIVVTPLFIGSQNTTSNPDTYSSVPFGSPSANRYILVALGSIISTAGTTTVTIGGVAATQVVTASANDDRAMWIANVPSGTSGNIVFTRSTGTVTASIIQVYSITGLSSPTPVANGSDAASPYATSFATTNNGVCFGAMFGFLISATPPVDTLSGVATDGTQAQIYQSGTRNIRTTFGHDTTNGSNCSLTGTTTGTSGQLYGVSFF